MCLFLLLDPHLKGLRSNLHPSANRIAPFCWTSPLGPPSKAPLKALAHEPSAPPLWVYHGCMPPSTTRALIAAEADPTESTYAKHVATLASPLNNLANFQF